MTPQTMIPHLMKILLHQCRIQIAAVNPLKAIKKTKEAQNRVLRKMV